MKQNDMSGDPRSTLERFPSLRQQPANWGQNVSARYIKTLLQESTAETAALSVNTRRVAGKRTEEGRPPRGLTTELLLFAHGRTAHGRRLLEQIGLDLCQHLQRFESAGRAATRNQAAAHIEESHR